MRKWHFLFRRSNSCKDILIKNKVIVQEKVSWKPYSQIRFSWAANTLSGRNFKALSETSLSKEIHHVNRFNLHSKFYTIARRLTLLPATQLYDMTTLMRGSFKNRELLLVNIIFQDFFEHYFLGSMINCDYETYLGRFIYTSSSCFCCVRKYYSWKVIGQNYVFLIHTEIAITKLNWKTTTDVTDLKLFTTSLWLYRFYIILTFSYLTQN